MSRLLLALQAALMLLVVTSWCHAQPSFLQTLKQTPPKQGQTKPVEVITRGESALSFEDARQQAMREAIERVCGVYLWSETKAEDFEVVTDRILTRSAGFARIEEIHRGKTGEIYWVLARVFVSERPILEQLKQAGLLRQWRIAVLVPETLMDSPPPPDPAVETALIKQLVGAGFRVADREVTDKYRDEEIVAQAARGNTSLLRRLLQETRADILIIGEAFSQALGRLPGGLVSCRARVELRVVVKETGEVLFSDSEHQSAIDATAQLAGKKALEKAAEQISGRLIERLLFVPASDRAVVTVVVEGVPSLTEAGDLENVLSSLPGVLKVTRDEFINGVVYLQVELRLSETERIGDHLEKGMSGKLQVLASTKTFVRCLWK